MTESTNPQSPQFLQFPLLPTEIRLQIWQTALPNPDRQALFCYKKGCWKTRPDDEGHFMVEFHPDCLDPIHVSVPLFLVNHEAHAIAHRWIHEQGLAIRFHRPTNTFLFLRRYHPASDGLYVPHAQYRGFICEPVYLPFEPESEALGTDYGTVAPQVSRIAFPKTVLLEDDHYHRLTWLFEDPSYENTREVLVVMNDAAANLRQWGWEVVPGAEQLVWDHDQRAFRREMGRQGQDLEADAFFRLVERASVGIDETDGWRRNRPFEVKPVFLRADLELVYTGASQAALSEDYLEERFTKQLPEQYI
ncbi:hypothetical protein BO78DRAFT_386900 [Aspergillus sclerotiicarbonarius CBS 121057]|uniref:2EXR domain-containing protein n=1 Tax=Aspergillus sclerotiicarbonarius (strain CBS 121057 / IBT 28362) TaxID=1448318 RepID=A0A319EA61_ASPSB|nr:hypothetical protein BO78DRAFT_386900 [Aspergillus sclerotiicarbonarius CBS 121057]